MSRPWTQEELATASSMMKQMGFPSFEEFKEQYLKEFIDFCEESDRIDAEEIVPRHCNLSRRV